MAQSVVIALVGKGDGLLARVCRDFVALETNGARQAGLKVRVHLGKRHKVVRSLRTGEAGDNGAEVKLQGLGELGVSTVVVPQHALRLQVGTDVGQLFLAAPGRAEIIKGLAVHREVANGRSVLGSLQLG